MGVLLCDEFLIVAFETEGFQVIRCLDLEQQRSDRPAVGIVAIGATLRRVVDRFPRLELGGNFFVAADAQARRFLDGKLVQVTLGCVTLLTFSGRGEIGPVDVLMVSGVDVTIAARA
jgi:hypothetical protein